MSLPPPDRPGGSVVPPWSGLDRRVGPPDRRKPKLSWGGEITAGAVLQALTVLGSCIGSIFAAGSYVEHLRDTIEAAQMQRTSDEDRMQQMLDRYFSTHNLQRQNEQH